MKEDNKVLNEYIDALELTKTNNLDYYFLNKSKESLWSFINTSIKADSTLVFLKNLSTGFHQLISIALAAVLSMTIDGSSAGDLVFYLFVSDMILNTSQKIESSIYSLTKMMPSFENVNSILNLNKCKGTKNIETIETIEFKDVDFYYECNQNMVMCKKNAMFRKGDIIKVTGLNGGGKSTFVKLIKGLLYPKMGDVFLNGLSTKDISLNSLKDQILYINQDEIILNDDIKTYIEAISGQKISDLELNQLKQTVGFDDSILRITGNGQSLSGGQRKKLLMIKLLLKYKTASVIILDEIEAGLDVETKNIVAQLEKEIIKSKSDCIFFKITHESKDTICYTETINI